MVAGRWADGSVLKGLKSCLTCFILNQKVEHFKQFIHYILIDACSHYKLRG